MEDSLEIGKAFFRWALENAGEEPVSVSLANLEFESLRLAYAESHRVWHVWSHIEDKIGWTAKLAASNAHQMTCAMLAQNLIADFYHAAVYDSRSKTNEADSAAVAEAAWKRLFRNAPYPEKISRLILATQRHNADPSDIQEQIQIDGDLAVSQAAAEVYLSYAEAIRTEYSWVGNEEYRAGRKAVLISFDRPNLYHFGAVFHNELVSKNILVELDLLNAGHFDL